MESTEESNELVIIPSMDVPLPEPTVEEGFGRWNAWKWKGVSIPQWRGILVESQAQGDEKREKYARWMLRDVLKDPRYTEDR